MRRTRAVKTKNLAREVASVEGESAAPLKPREPSMFFSTAAASREDLGFKPKYPRLKDAIAAGA